MIEKILNRTQPNFIYGAMASAIVLFVLGSYLYLFKNSLAEYALMKETRTMLQETEDSDTQLAGAISDRQRQVEALLKRLQGESSPLPVNQLVTLTIDRLDHIAAHHDIQLVSVTPDEPKPVASLEELPFSIEVVGKYQHLAGWLHEVEKDLSPMVVKQFEIIPLSGEEPLSMRVEIVSYRLPMHAI